MGATDPNLSRGSGGRDFVFWPEENGGKRPEVDLEAVAKKLFPGEEPALVERLVEGLVEGVERFDESVPEPTVYPATSAWRRTTSRTVSNDEERWWESVAPRRDASTGVPSPFEVKPARAESLMTPDEIWEMTARELADAPVMRAKSQSPVAEPVATEPPATTQPPTVEAKSVARETVAPESFANAVLPRETLACEAAAPHRAQSDSAPSEFEPIVRQLPASLKASPFTIATGSTEPLAAAEPVSALRMPAATRSLDDELIFPRAGKPLPADYDPERSDFERSDLDPPPRRIFTIWRVILLLLFGAGMAAFFYRSELSAIDWRGLWGNAMRSAGLSGSDSSGPARRAFLVPGQLKSRSSSNGQDDYVIESGPGADATPVPAEPAAPKAGSPSVAEPPMPATERDTPAASPPAAVEAAALRDGSSTLWSGDEAPSAPEPGLRTQNSGPIEGQLSTSDQTEATEARTAVQNLITAESVEKVLPWIFDPSKLGSTVREYHVSHPLKGLNGAVVELGYAGIIASSGAKAFIFTVIHPDHPRGFPVSVEHTPEGYRIDWQSYIQWRHEWLRRFLENKSAEPQMLFVVLRRAHYFNDDVPRLDEKICFKISSAVPGDEGTFAFVDHPSALARSLSSTYEWRNLYFPVVEVQWIREPNSVPYVRLNRIVRPTWRRVGD